MSSNSIAAPSQATARPTEAAMAALPENDELEAVSTRHLIYE